MPPTRPTLARRYCCTLNNYTEIQYHTLIHYLQPLCKYLIIGREVGESGTPHFQIYFNLMNKKRPNSIKDICNRLHIEIARGSEKQNKMYCKKDKNYYEFPESTDESTTRKQASIDFIEAKTNGKIQEWAQKYPHYHLFNYQQMESNYNAMQPPIERPNINVKWIYGSPGVGKTRWAHATLPNAYIKDPKTKWWHNYQLQREVIIDDFAKDSIDITRLLAWFDRYKCTVETKGGQLPLYADKFILTSNFTPEEVYPDHPQLPALHRRITLINYNAESILPYSSPVMEDR